MKQFNNIKLILFVAFMQLRARKTQTIVATIGVAFGITVFIFLLSSVKGVNYYISELSLEQCADIRLFNEVRVSAETVYDRKFAPEMAVESGNEYSYESSDWLKDNLLLFEGQELQNIVFRCIAASILLAAGFGIFNILNVMIYKKIKDISIIKAMGFTDKDVRMIFMVHALTIGIISTVAGLLLGYLLSWAITFMPFESDFYISMKPLPMCYNVLYILGLCFGLLTTAMAGYLSSRKAAKLDPIPILRG